jgi:predicted transcriptional regulator
MEDRIATGAGNMTEENAVQEGHDLLELAGQIVTAYAARNPISPADLLKLIDDVMARLSSHSKPTPEGDKPILPAVSTNKSKTANHLVCLECGGKFKTLRRHIGRQHSLTPEGYRRRYQLSADYPMTAPNYSATRSTIAKANDFGRRPETPRRRSKQPT